MDSVSDEDLEQEYGLLEGFYRDRLEEEWRRTGTDPVRSPLAPEWSVRIDWMSN